MSLEVELRGTGLSLSPISNLSDRVMQGQAEA